MNLRDLARGQPCAVRLPGVCLGTSETVVLAHLRRAAAAGTGQKPPDIVGVHACMACHDVIDGRQKCPWLDPERIDSYVLDGLVRTLCRVWPEIEAKL